MNVPSQAESNWRWRCPAKMQAVRSYKAGEMLFLGLGTGLGSTIIVDGIIEPMEVGHLPYKKRTYEDYVVQRGLERMGKTEWRRSVANVVARLILALEPDELDSGGGNAVPQEDPGNGGIRTLAQGNRAILRARNKENKNGNSYGATHHSSAH